MRAIGFWRTQRRALLLLVLLAALPVLSVAANTVVVQGVVSPAWRERSGVRQPLVVGMALGNQDRVVTGERGRALLGMSEGSAIKLGENAALALDGLAESKKADGTPQVQAALEVLKGAFRFTTGVFGRPAAERQVAVKFGTVTAGVRGTDLWGRSIATDDLVCLLEGRISVQHADKEYVMDQPLQFFVAPRDQPAKPVGTVSQQQLDEWTRETEIVDGQGAMRAGARDKVEIARFADEAAARALQVRLQAAGYPALVDPAGDAAYGATEFVVSVGGLATAGDGATVIERVKPLLGR